MTKGPKMKIGYSADFGYMVIKGKMRVIGYTKKFNRRRWMYGNRGNRKISARNRAPLRMSTDP